VLPESPLHLMDPTDLLLGCYPLSRRDLMGRLLRCRRCYPLGRRGLADLLLRYCQ